LEDAVKLPLRLPKPGPLLDYHAWLHGKNPELAKETIFAVRDALKTPGGAILLEMLEKAIALSPVEICGDDRALAARNAQGFILTDLQRMASDEFEKVLDGQADTAGTRRTNVRRQPRSGS